ncbi:MAG: DUF3168 domain-containing protein [Altererythrobacter sp.]|nr:DUF3168 domain-containing protein [Altererythrobacter sp.]OJU60589.1 MAG: DUF3168 domain-containing protein [Altererythrobacter sp. 66-12]
METELRAALIAWLAVDAELMSQLNAVTEEAPSRTAPPWLGIAASASADWSTKDRAGREIRLALELHWRGDDPGTMAATARAIETRVEAMPRAQAGFDVVNIVFLRARAEQRPGNVRAVLIEYRFRVLASEVP